MTLPGPLNWGRVTARPLSPHRVRRTLELRVHEGVNECLRGLVFVRNAEALLAALRQARERQDIAGPVFAFLLG